MPNWITNRLKIYGEKTELALFDWQTYSDSVRCDRQLLFSQYYPAPSDIEGEKLLDWNRKYYGCKWDCWLDFIDKNDNEINLEFQSPWTPPIKGIIYLSTLFSRCIFELLSTDKENIKTGQHILSLIRNGVIENQIYKSCFGKLRTCCNCGAEFAPPVDWNSNITDNHCYFCHEKN